MRKRYVAFQKGSEENMSFKKRYQVFTLCDNCNKEFELSLNEDNAGTFTIMQACPYCHETNHRWIRIKERKEETK